MTPEKATIRETIKVRLPDPFKRCLAEISVFRNSKTIEESMSMQLPDTYTGRFKPGVQGIIEDGIPGTKFHEFERDSLNFSHYKKCFPDSSMFSYLITSMKDLWYDFCENDGYNYVRDISLSDGTNISVFELEIEQLYLRPKVGFNLPARFAGARDDNSCFPMSFFDFVWWHHELNYWMKSGKIKKNHNLY